MICTNALLDILEVLKALAVAHHLWGHGFLGSTVLQGKASPHLSLVYPTGHNPWGDPGEGGFLGMAHGPFRLVGGKGDSTSTKSAENMVLRDLSLERLQDREQLRKAVDNLRRDIDQTGNFTGVDEFTQQALGILSSSKLAQALDLSDEDPALWNATVNLILNGGLTVLRR